MIFRWRGHQHVTAGDVMPAAKLYGHLDKRLAQWGDRADLKRVFSPFSDRKAGLAQPREIISRGRGNNTEARCIDALFFGSDQLHLDSQDFAQDRLATQFTQANSCNLPGKQQRQK